MIYRTRIFPFLRILPFIIWFITTVLCPSASADGGSPSNAGTYTVSYSVSSGAGTYKTGQYTDSEPYHVGSGGVFSVLGEEQGPGETHTTGTITATFTWNPLHTGQAPPPCIIVREIVSASGYIDQIPDDSTPTASPGLSSKYIVINGQSQGYVYATGYTVMTNPPVTFTVTASPEAYSGYSTGNTGSGCSYSADCGAVAINLAGTTQISNAPHILVGQHLTASLSVPYGTVDSTSYQWGITGDAFKSWTYSAQKAYPVALLTGTDLTSPTLSCYHRSNSPAASVVTCSAKVNLPYSTQQISVTTNATVAVDTPVLYATHYFGAVRLSTSDDVQYGGGGVIPNGIFVLPDTTKTLPSWITNPTNGMVWWASVQLPTSWPSGVLGNWYFLQTAVPQLEWGTTTEVKMPSINGVVCLDSKIPYDQTYGTSSARQQDGDSPGLGRGSEPWTYAKVTNQQFATYIMFVPPQTDSASIPVPVALIPWYFSGTLDYTKNPPQVSGAVPAGASPFSFYEWHVHPIWNGNTATYTIVTKKK